MTRPRIAVAGAGRMGRGIAHVFAWRGFTVDVIDLKDRDEAAAAATLAAAADEIAASVGLFKSLGLIDDKRQSRILSRISYHPRARAAAALAGAGIVFEGVPEVMEIKRPALETIARHAPADALIASTTSTFLVDSLAEFVARPGRFLNAHWLNPAYLIPLVEVSPGRATTPESVARLKEALEAAGKVAVVCAASPGYIVPRIQALAMNEAARMADEGVAAPEEIDRAIRVGFGIRFAVLGLIEFIDWGGGDILYYASNYLKEALGEERFAPPEVVRRNMADGRLGLSTGQGFYDFRDTDIAAYRRDRIAAFVDLIGHLGLLAAPADEE